MLSYLFTSHKEDIMDQSDRKAYEQPAVVYEADLEVRAGSTIMPEFPNLFGE